jgi:hypothetical protein
LADGWVWSVFDALSSGAGRGVAASVSSSMLSNDDADERAGA